MTAKRAKPAVAQNSWNPMSTAPRDGTRILVWYPYEDADHPEHVGIDRWRENVWWHARRDQQPAYWMPLPQPPNENFN